MYYSVKSRYVILLINFIQALSSTLALYLHCFMPACGKGRLRIKGVLKKD
jgi:hypothetical protein